MTVCGEVRWCLLNILRAGMWLVTKQKITLFWSQTYLGTACFEWIFCCFWFKCFFKTTAITLHSKAYCNHFFVLEEQLQDVLATGFALWLMMSRFINWLKQSVFLFFFFKILLSVNIQQNSCTTVQELL